MLVQYNFVHFYKLDLYLILLSIFVLINDNLFKFQLLKYNQTTLTDHCAIAAGSGRNQTVSHEIPYIRNFLFVSSNYSR